MIVTAMHDATQQSVIVKNLCETAYRSLTDSLTDFDPL